MSVLQSDTETLFVLCFRSTETCPSCQTLRSPLHFAISTSVSRKIWILKIVTNEDAKLTGCCKMLSSCSLEVNEPLPVYEYLDIVASYSLLYTKKSSVKCVYSSYCVSVNMFSAVLMPLLDLCTVQPDATVTSHAFFGPKSQIG